MQESMLLYSKDIFYCVTSYLDVFELSAARLVCKNFKNMVSVLERYVCTVEYLKKVKEISTIMVDSPILIPILRWFDNGKKGGLCYESPYIKYHQLVNKNGFPKVIVGNLSF
jgi:hypothetical protein